MNSKDAIIHEIQKLSKRGAGVSVKVLKESWKGSAEAIKELEEEGLVLVMRAGKNDEKNAKFVFWNAQSRAEAEEMKVDDGQLIIRQLSSLSLTCCLTEFRRLWAEQRVPEEADVVRALNNGEFNQRAINPKTVLMGSYRGPRCNCVPKSRDSASTTEEESSQRCSPETSQAHEYTYHGHRSLQKLC